MTIERALDLLKIERACVMKANTCGRDCANCALVQEDTELIKMYNYVISAMEIVKEALDNAS